MRLSGFGAKLALVLALGVIAGVLGALYVSAPMTAMDASTPVMKTVDCDPAAGPCSAVVDGLTISLTLGPPIRPLEPMPVALQVAGGTIESPRISFTMVDMEMGLNRYGLQVAGSGRWATEAILPVCSLGRRDWLASVEYTAGGRRQGVAFSFPSDP